MSKAIEKFIEEVWKDNLLDLNNWMERNFDLISLNFRTMYVDKSCESMAERFSKDRFFFHVRYLTNIDGTEENEPLNFYMQTSLDPKDDNIGFRLFSINYDEKLIDFWLTDFKGCLETDQLKSEFEELLREFFKNAKKYFMLHKIERLKNE